MVLQIPIGRVNNGHFSSVRRPMRHLRGVLGIAQNVNGPIGHGPNGAQNCFWLIQIAGKRLARCIFPSGYRLREEGRDCEPKQSRPV